MSGGTMRSEEGHRPCDVLGFGDFLQRDTALLAFILSFDPIAQTITERDTGKQERELT